MSSKEELKRTVDRTARTPLILGLLLANIAIGSSSCGKKTPAISAAEQQQQPAASASQQALVGEVNQAMTAQLRIFEQIAGRLPTNFTELVRTRLDVVPRHPPGFQWAIDPVTKEVKLVKE